MFGDKKNKLYQKTSRQDNKVNIETILYVKIMLQRDGTAHRSQFKI